MNRTYEPSWTRKLLLLTALVAGVVATQLVPPFQELAFRPAEEQSASDPSKPVATSRGMTGVDVSKHYLDFIRGTS